MSQKISFKKKICDCPMKVIPLNTIINLKELKTLLCDALYKMRSYRLGDINS